ncbi:MAG TPA: hypothetical protein VFV24_09425, partial [Candidatus Eisenbacteria bacterium]|nr:hypothetical protein [Candidatus Eisenbacteria bacterium]
PGLVAWASGSQDLLAITFLLAALNLRHRGHVAWSVAAAAAGLLSKESILVAWPVLSFWDVLTGRGRSRLGHALVGFGGVALAWALLHPGLPTALAPPVAGDMPRYVGFRNLAVSGLQLRGYVGAILNLPLAAPVSDVPSSTIACGVVAALIAAVGGMAMKRRSRVDAGHVPLHRVAIIGLLIAIPGVILPSLVINRWVAYYACLPAAGIAIVLGALSARMPLIPALALLLAWLTMGIVTRGMESSSGILNERSFLEGSRAGQTVQEGFRALHPALPKGSQVLVSVASSGMLGIHGTLVDGQSPRIWYGDPTLHTLTPERRLPDRPNEVLVRVTSEQRVIEILADRLEHRASDGSPVDEDEVHMVIRTYARGVAASGETERSARILTSLAERDRDAASRSQDLRLAAMALRAGGEDARAESLLAAAPRMSRDLA